MLPKSCSSDDIHKSEANSLRKTHSTASTEIFDYLDNGISRSHSQFSGILTIAPLTIEKCQTSTCSIPTEIDVSAPKNEGIRGKLVEFLKKHIKIIPVMLKSSDSGEDKENNNTPEKAEDVEISRIQSSKQASELPNKEKMMDSDEVYEIDELNSTIAPSSSRQCIVGADLECAPPAPKKPKKKPLQQRTDFHPKPPFSCWPIYTAILFGLLVVLIIGAVTTIIDMKPEFIYGNNNSTNITLFENPQPIISMSTLKPQ